MVENISLPQNATVQPQLGLAAPKTPEQKAEIKSERAVDVKDAPKFQEQKDPQQTRFEAVKQAAQSVAQNPYPVSDVRFTIYQEKVDGNVIYVTRFTNLESGKVELVREPQLLTQAGNRNLGTLLTTEV